MSSLKSRKSRQINPVPAARQKNSGKVKNPIDMQSFLPFRFLRMGLRMSAAGNKLSTLIRKSGAPIGEREWRVIALLGAYGGHTNSQLAKISGLDAATVSRAVKTLKQIGFVDTLRSKRDRRRLLIYLTEAGAQYHDRITPKRIETGELIAAGLTQRELESLGKILDKLDQHLMSLENDSDEDWA